ncbi:MAG TPA: 23S rRNA (uridine(2552)-2'-O)-methyltransferase RlmE [Gammaproteobacteria bacterium]|jgi:23S rRNA (uridine2552-2'-O)-methyltransferase|nr:23S rRNA (uridine(2552)-2'-O)-methyltransferase RlmE [Gammaproteobacteria bacterium]
MAERSRSSRRWLKEHFADPYVQQAQQAGYRSRAVYKLLEIDQRDRLFKPGMRVVDLGAAPGGWCQVVCQRVKPGGQVFALDVLEMEPIPGVSFIQGDFKDEAVLEQLKTQLSGQQIDWVLSDMAPNMSGHKGVDIVRSIYLAELALDFALKVLSPTGGLLVKAFQGEGYEALLREIKNNFKKVVLRKPKASRERSREIYILARELKGKP